MKQPIFFFLSITSLLFVSHAQPRDQIYTEFNFPREWQHLRHQIAREWLEAIYHSGDLSENPLVQEFRAIVPDIIDGYHEWQDWVDGTAWLVAEYMPISYQIEKRLSSYAFHELIDPILVQTILLKVIGRDHYMTLVEQNLNLPNNLLGLILYNFSITIILDHSSGYSLADLLIYEETASLFDDIMFRDFLDYYGLHRYSREEEIELAMEHLFYIYIETFFGGEAFFYWMFEHLREEHLEIFIDIMFDPEVAFDIDMEYLLE